MMNSVRSRLVAVGAFALDLLRRLIAAARRHPVRAALVLPALMLLYVLALIPFTPSVGDLRKAKSATLPWCCPTMVSCLQSSNGSIASGSRWSASHGMSSTR
jgi:hypothetical protein